MGEVRNYLNSGWHCSEGILMAVGEHYLGDVDVLALHLTTPFAGGIGGTHEELCGALTGGIMAIGAIHGRNSSSTNDDHCMELVKKFRRRFTEHFGDKVCADLKANWVGKEGQEDCAELVAQAAGILVDVLELDM
jgi:C_GCAxxG_C_C family probable redox protein